MATVMKIVHFSITPLAGAPLRLVQVLRKHTDHEVRLIDLKPNPIFGEDIVFPRQREEAMAAAEKADILHLHNYLHLGSVQFAPIDFRALHRRGVRVIRHFHSTPDVVMSIGDLRHDQVFDGLPALVCGQFQERYYPEARVMPLVVLAGEASNAPHVETGCGAFFGPSNNEDMFERRWHVKGTPETRRMTARVCRQTGRPFHFMMGKPLEESLAAKRRSAVVIDELVTGGYHTTTLEALCLGRAVMTWLDLRTQRVFAEMAGTSSCPVINVHLGEAESILRYLLTHEEETQVIGRISGEWFATHWSEAKVAAQFDVAYQDLMESPDKIRRQPSLRIDDASGHFRAVVLPDIVHEKKRRQWLRTAPFGDTVPVRGRIAMRRIRKAIGGIPGARAAYHLLPGKRKEG